MSDKLGRFFGTQRDYLRSLFRRIDPEFAAFVPRAVGILLGIWLLLPWDTFDREPGLSPLGPFLRLIGLPVTEPYVGGGFLLYGVLGYLALSCGWRTLKRVMSAFGTFLWLWICLSLLIKNPAGVLWIFILPLALGALFGFIFGSEWRRRL